MAANETFARFTKGYSTLVEFNKANIAALVQANTVLAKGVLEISKEIFNQTQASVQSIGAAGTSLRGIKSAKDGVALATDSAKAGYDKFVVNATKVGELSSKVTKEALAPVAERIDAVIAKVGKPAEQKAA
jgi:phasin family protein